MTARKISIPALVKQLTEAHVPFRVTQDKDGNTILEALTAPVVKKPMADIREEMARLIDEIPSRQIRSRG